MKEDLRLNWGINAVTLYDRPRRNFVPTVAAADLWRKYGIVEPTEDDLLVVSSTSWTTDEDFSLLLNAVEQYDRADEGRPLRAFISGKGPEKAAYVARIAELRKGWRRVAVETVWLDADDYPALLSLCHVGVCLHLSSSGLDLPMKVVDMFGAGLPVLAVHYRCIGELLTDGCNGYTFRNAQELCQRLIELSSNRATLQQLQLGAQKERELTWDI
jgi:beta-1,4-mannosyltransferase